jgi:S-adenosylmethionine-diacylgycerolhomoserine-N-methlytransferase
MAGEPHRDFLNRYYKWSRPIYDLTRKYYLFGRDTLITELVREPWRSLVEIGPGTGRNLQKIARKRPDAVLGGVEPCDEMLALARKRLPHAMWVRGFAEDARFDDVMGGPVDRVMCSYSLSMMGDPDAAIDRALEQLGPHGELAVVDFGDLAGAPRVVRESFHTWLNTFHVTPIDVEALRQRGATVRFGPLRYFFVARLRRPVVA